MLGRAALLAIGGYQRWLSPRKGWGCAYRLAHGGPGCSGFAKEAIAEAGLIGAWPAIRHRFRDCHAAALRLGAEAPEETRGRRDRWCDIPAVDCGGCFELPCVRHGPRDPTPDGCDCTPGGCGD